MRPNPAITLMQADLIHLPAKYDRHQVQMLFFDMSRKMYGGYQSLAFNFGNSEMFTVYGSGGSSRLQLLPDRFRVLEQNTGISSGPWYHNNWLENLLISGSLRGYRAPPQNPL